MTLKTIPENEPNTEAVMAVFTMLIGIANSEDDDEPTVNTDAQRFDDALSELRTVDLALLGMVGVVANHGARHEMDFRQRRDR